MNAVIALNPQQMQEAQVTTTAWVDAKIAAAEVEVDEADKVLDAISNRGLNRGAARSLLDKAARRLRFYEKVKAALLAGYYIIPPFNIQLFAVRTDRRLPTDRSDRHWVRNEPTGRALAIGQGDYVNPVPNRLHIADEKQGQGEHQRTVAIYENEWKDEIGLPVRALKPQLIEAVGRALDLKIFDALGIAPAYRAADPIIAGQIKRPDGKGVLTFFVAWWLDESDL